jgi:hypothetical protein
MLLWQDMGDLVGVATLSSCKRGVSAKALRNLLAKLGLASRPQITAWGGHRCIRQAGRAVASFMYGRR